MKTNDFDKTLTIKNRERRDVILKFLGIINRRITHPEVKKITCKYEESLTEKNNIGFQFYKIVMKNSKEVESEIEYCFTKEVESEIEYCFTTELAGKYLLGILEGMSLSG